ncbi:MAG: helix-turn-helix domain-containing protein [Oscillospiraceae bacterium]|nr:helix-turn-helix domain-containing protein [Oscillospiraceae bacterium]
MNTYITGATIKRLREGKGLTQAQLAEEIGVSSKAVSKWETAKGLPDITLIEPLAKSLGVSVMELMSGDTVINRNVCANLLRSVFYVCPVCGNILHATGEAAVSCCGITLPPLEAEEADESHGIKIERVEDENFITMTHSMSKAHYISFLAWVTSDSIQLVKLYPEGDAQTRFQLRGSGFLYAYCNRHGLFRVRVGR